MGETGTSGEDGKSSRIVYTVDERPPFGRSVVYAFQHIFAMILGSITGAVIIGTTVGLDEVQIGNLVGYINTAVGIATIAQVAFGVRLPVIQGSTSGHLPAYLALGSVGVSLYADATLTMQYLMGALLVGALLEAGVGALNVVRWLRRVVSPITIGIVIMMVGLGLWPIVNGFIGDGWHFAIVVFILVLVFSFAFNVMVKTMALFLAVVVAYSVAAAGTALGWFPVGHGLHVNFPAIAEAAWINVPGIFPWGPPKFNLGFILAMTIPYFATAFESLGDYIAVSHASNVPTPTVKRLSRGLLTEGVASAIASVLGATATSSFSQNVGVVRLTGVASRFVCILAGVILILLGLFGKFGAILGAVPRLILGAVYLVAFGILVMTGLSLVLKADVRTSRNEAIVGTSILLGLALPQYMADNPIELGASMAAAQVFLNVFLATPMMVSGVWALVLDNVIPGSDEERGLVGWLSPPEEADASEGEGKREPEAPS